MLRKRDILSKDNLVAKLISRNHFVLYGRVLWPGIKAIKLSNVCFQRTKLFCLLFCQHMTSTSLCKSCVQSSERPVSLILALSFENRFSPFSVFTKLIVTQSTFLLRCVTRYQNYLNCLQVFLLNAISFCFSTNRHGVLPRTLTDSIEFRAFILMKNGNS